MKRAIILTVVLAALLVLGVCCQQQSFAQDTETPKTLALGEITIDVDNGAVSFPATVCLRSGMLEAVVCKSGTKEHESILSTTVQPSMVHAALLSLGLTPGLPARWIDIPEADGVTTPPRGGLVRVDLSWTDAEGIPHTVPATDWLIKSLDESDYEGQDAEDPDADTESVWVFVGSDLLATGDYWADGSGDLISVSNFASTVLDVPFESTDRNDDLLYQANTAAIPPEGTQVTVTLTPLDDATESPYARKWLFLDAAGDMSVDGQVVTMNDLTQWAMDFVRDHGRGQVVVWLDPSLPSRRAQQVWEALRVGGVFDIREVRAITEAPWLPLSQTQQDELLADMTDRFENPKDFYESPHDRSELILKEIEARKAELARQEAILDALSVELQTMMDEYPRVAEDETNE